jgi:hypothetical protein
MSVSIDTAATNRNPIPFLADHVTPSPPLASHRQPDSYLIQVPELSAFVLLQSKLEVASVQVCIAVVGSVAVIAKSGTSFAENRKSAEIGDILRSWAGSKDVPECKSNFHVENRAGHGRPLPGVPPAPELCRGHRREGDHIPICLDYLDLLLTDSGDSCLLLGSSGTQAGHHHDDGGRPTPQSQER